jgi:hypothetical protein
LINSECKPNLEDEQDSKEETKSDEKKRFYGQLIILLCARGLPNGAADKPPAEG